MALVMSSGGGRLVALRPRIVAGGERLDLLAIVGGTHRCDLLLVRARYDDAAHDRDQQQQRDRLEGVKEIAEKDVADRRDRAVRTGYDRRLLQRRRALHDDRVGE